MTFVAGFLDLERKIANEHGDFTLFALVLREDATGFVPIGDRGSSDRWDLVVAAPWLDPDKKSDLNYLISKIKTELGSEQLLDLSKVVILDSSNKAVQALNRAIKVEHGQMELENTELFGLFVRKAYIITSKRPHAVTKQPTAKSV
jgi:hypothetical protein